MVVIYARGLADNSLWEYADRRGWEPQVVSDADVLVRAVRAGKVEIVLCSSLKGLGRSLPGLVQVPREFVAHKTVLIIPSQGINISKVLSEAFLGMLLDSIAAFKNSVARERINAGLAAAKKRGTKLGRAVKIAAYREGVAKLRAQGLTGRAIGKELGVPSSSVFRIIGQLEAA